MDPLLSPPPAEYSMSSYAAGLLMGGLIGFLVAFWVILAYVAGWWGDRP